MYIYSDFRWFPERMEDEWKPIFYIESSVHPSHLSGSDFFETGWIESWPNIFSENVTVRLAHSSETRTMHMPWSDRFPGFAEFLSQCAQVFRLAVLIRDKTIWKYCLHVHQPEFRAQMERRGCVPGEVFALSLFRVHAKNCHICQPSPLAFREEEAADAPLATSPAWNPRCPLFASQLRSVAWMQGIEARICHKKNVMRYATCLPVADTEWAYDFTGERFTQWDHAAWLKTRYRGAVLTDAAGSGKTACALALIASTLDEPSAAAEPPAADERDMPRSNATLIIVPQNLPGQWVEEIHKFLPAPGTPRVVCIADVKDAKQHTFRSLLEADIVITTTNFLKCKTYNEHMEQTLCNVLGQVDRRYCRDKYAIRCGARAIHILRSTPGYPLIEMVHWKRVVVDEIHEYFYASTAARDRQRHLRILEADRWWGLTGTPNRATSEAVQAFYFFLVPKLCDDAQQYHHHPCLQSAVEHVLLRSHSDCPSHVSVRHVLHPVRLTAQERILLDSHETVSLERVVHICTTFAAHAEEETGKQMTLPEIAAVLQVKREWAVANAKAEVARAEEELRRQSDDDDRGDELRELLEERHRRCDTACRELEFMRSRITALEAGDESCPICLDSAARAITRCGHLFCYECIAKHAQANQTCPSCRAELRGPVSIIEFADQDPMVAAVGSKLASLGRFVRDVAQRGERAVVFVQWRHLEDALVHALRCFGVEPLRLAGAHHARHATLQRFKHEPRHVLLLLLEQSSAGLHLACAQHAVFVHTVCETGMVSLEEQAIGRIAREGQARSVQIHHFVAEHTREHSAWLEGHLEYETYAEQGEATDMSVG